MHKPVVKEWLLNNVFMPWRNIRLPRHVRPSTYNINLQPNISQTTFKGEEEIIVTVGEPTDYILIHQTDLKIENTEIKDLKTGDSLVIDEEFQYKKNDYWIIILEKKISEGEYSLKIQFSGTISDGGGNGIRKHSYIHEEDWSKR